MDNLFIKLLDRRGRVMWVSDGIDAAVWDKPMLEYADEPDRAIVEENFSRCVVKGETVQFSARWYCPLADATVSCLTVIHPLEPESLPTSVAAVLVQSILPENFDEFTDADRELLCLLANDRNIKDVATTVDRSESAIDARIRGLKTKLGKHTLHGLVAAAVRNRLVPLFPPEFTEMVARALQRPLSDVMEDRRAADSQTRA